MTGHPEAFFRALFPRDGQYKSCAGPEVGFEEIAIDLSEARFGDITIDPPSPFLNSVLLIHRSAQQTLVDSVIRAQPHTLMAADTVFRSGRASQ